jgi:hypothetical protein
MKVEMGRDWYTNGSKDNPYKLLVANVEEIRVYIPFNRDR